MDVACRQIANGQPVTVHLLNVQSLINSGIVKNYLSQDLIDKLHQEQGEATLESARGHLDGRAWRTSRTSKSAM